MRLLLIILFLLPSLGCTYSHHHPVRTKLFIVGAGVGFGVLAGLETRTVFCPTTINGYKYYGTSPCPSPNYEPPGGRKH